MGFSGDDKPVKIFPTIVGRIKNPCVNFQVEHNKDYVGDEVDERL